MLTEAEQLLVEPPAGVLALGRAKRTDDFPIVARDEASNLLFALDEDRERGGLNASDGCQLKAPGLGIEGRHRARAIDADEPVGLRSTDGGVSKRQHRFIATQCTECITNRGGRHRLQP